MKAFPLLSKWDDEKLNGMDLRDYFATHAQIPTPNLTLGEISKMAGHKEYKNPTTEECCAAVVMEWARLRYEYADAMMEARKK